VIMFRVLAGLPDSALPQRHSPFLFSLQHAEIVAGVVRLMMGSVILPMCGVIVVMRWDMTRTSVDNQ
jgi:hypothetical protein